MRAAAILCLAALAAAPARPADNDSTQSVVSAVYSVISGPAGPRDWVRFRALFAAGARLITMTGADGEKAALVMTPEEFAERAGANFEKSAFYESELVGRTELFGGIAHVFSTYESRRAPGEKPFARGVNSFQLVKEGKAWKVMTILWDAESPSSPLPEKYLK